MRISAIRNGEPLHNSCLINSWRERTDDYPEVVRHAMVDNGLGFWPRARIDLPTRRSDVLLLHIDLVDIVRQILDVLMGLNGISAPHPWHKWLDSETTQLKRSPEDLNRRIRGLLRADSRSAADEAVALVRQTFDLVDRYLPEFDTTDKRDAFDERRVDPPAIFPSPPMSEFGAPPG